MNYAATTLQPVTDVKQTAFGEINTRLETITMRLADVLLKQAAFHDRLTGPQPTEDTKGGVNPTPSAIGWQVNDKLYQIENQIANIEYHTNRLADVA